MRDELEQQLVEDYPEIFELLTIEPEELDDSQPVPTIMISGIAVNDGWYDLIDTLCDRLDALNVDCTAVQVKEKFGGLRFYVDGIEHEDERRAYQASGAITFAQEMSRNICEDCGDRGEMRRGGWIRTLCDDCHNERD